MRYCAILAEPAEIRIFHPRDCGPPRVASVAVGIRRFGGSRFRQIPLLAGEPDNIRGRLSQLGRAVVQMICARIPVEDNAFGRLSVGLNRVCWTRRSDCRLMDGDARLFDPHSSSIRGPGSIVLSSCTCTCTYTCARARARARLVLLFHSAV